MTAVLDSSALLALLFSEPGGEKTEAYLSGALMSAVNLAETVSKLADRGVAGQEAMQLLTDLPIRIAAFDERQAMRAGELRDPTRKLGLSIGDRACLILALAENAVAVTADKAWLELKVGVNIVSIR